MSHPAKRPLVLIDDEQSFLDLMKMLLTERLDCPVIGFSKPLEALAALPGLAPGVVVSDYNMPDLDGLELAKRAAPLVPDTVFVILSGRDLAGEAARVSAVPAIRSVLTKPLTWRRVAEEIIRVWPAGAGAPPALR
ncbi:MAG: response regulator [Opitutaceae bacterium]|nr:response regulator [Opitutaceae bacterium]